MPGKKSIPNWDEFEHLILESGENFMRQALERMLNLIMELEVEAAAGAAKHQRTNERKAYRNGTRLRSLSTGVGKVQFLIPKESLVFIGTAVSGDIRLL